jgi:hypothetical protein
VAPVGIGEGRGRIEIAGPSREQRVNELNDRMR